MSVNTTIYFDPTPSQTTVQVLPYDSSVSVGSTISIQVPQDINSTTYQDYNLFFDLVKTKEELTKCKEMLGKIINDLPIGLQIKYIQKFPELYSFITFPAEVIRNTFNFLNADK